MGLLPSARTRRIVARAVVVDTALDSVLIQEELTSKRSIERRRIHALDKPAGEMVEGRGKNEDTVPVLARS